LFTEAIKKGKQNMGTLKNLVDYDMLPMPITNFLEKRYLAEKWNGVTLEELVKVGKTFDPDEEKVRKCIEAMCEEGSIEKRGDLYLLCKAGRLLMSMRRRMGKEELEKSA
jgi:hypothetical protein